MRRLPEKIDDGHVIQAVVVPSQEHGIASQRRWVTTNQSDHVGSGGRQLGNHLLAQPDPGRVGDDGAEGFGAPTLHLGPHR